MSKPQKQRAILARHEEMKVTEELRKRFNLVEIPAEDPEYVQAMHKALEKYALQPAPAMPVLIFLQLPGASIARGDPVLQRGPMTRRSLTLV